MPTELWNSRGYILRHTLCNSCVYDKLGEYNGICVHCPNKHYSKNMEPSFLPMEKAEMMKKTKEDDE